MLLWRGKSGGKRKVGMKGEGRERKRGKGMKREFGERVKVVKDFWRNCWGGGYFVGEEEYGERKEDKKREERGMGDMLLEDGGNVVRSLWECCGKLG